MTTPKLPVIDVDVTAINAMLERVKLVASDEDFILISMIVVIFLKTSEVLGEANASISRVRRFFGLGRSEKLKELKAKLAALKAKAKKLSSDPNPSPAKKQETRDATTDDSEVVPPPAPPPVKPKRKGHGRLAADEYHGAKHISVKHASLRRDDPCPCCTKGTVYPFPSTPIIRVTGQAPLGATAWDPERFRCGSCGELFTARLPPEAQGEKYDEAAASVIAVLHAGTGMPFHRLERLQANMGIPVPASVQWEIIRDRSELVLPVFHELERIGAQAELLHCDDSHMRILSLMGLRRAKLVADNALEDPKRTGLFTTSIIAIGAEVGPIALFYTGRKHAGENVAALLEKRDTALPVPMLMGDAAARNVPEGCVVVEVNCLTHGRRNVVDEIVNFPTECLHLVGQIALIYRLDNECKKKGFSNDERLGAHQKDSASVMEALRKWMADQLDEKRIEPNCGLGKAFNYFLKRWEKFTVFLRVPGAPLDNNICERALKMAIKLRKGSLFYRSERGAGVGDIYMTLIHTAELHRQNPVDYLTELQCNYKAVAETPGDWLPWNYKDTLDRLRASRAARWPAAA